MAVQKSKKSIWKKKLKLFNKIKVLVKKYFIPLKASIKNTHFKLMTFNLNLIKIKRLQRFEPILSSKILKLKYSIKLNRNLIKLYNFYLILLKLESE